MPEHRGHDPDQSALIVEVAEAEPVVAEWRQRFDPAAPAGVPAHVTLLYPFQPPHKIDDRTLQRVLSALSPFQAFPVNFSQAASFPGVVWLRPEPDGRFRQLTVALAREFPEFPPYGGAVADPVPHLTVGQDLNDDHHAEVLTAMQTRLRGKPISSHVDHAALYISDHTGRWTRHTRFRLSSETPPHDR